MLFCQILNNKAHWIFEADIKPEFAPNIVLVDVTNLNPQPQEGWNYDSVANTFSENDPQPTIPQPTQDERLSQLEANQLTLMSALADMYADMAAKGTV